MTNIFGHGLHARGLGRTAGGRAQRPGGGCDGALCETTVIGGRKCGWWWGQKMEKGVANSAQVTLIAPLIHSPQSLFCSSPEAQSLFHRGEIDHHVSSLGVYSSTCRKERERRTQSINAHPLPPSPIQNSAPFCSPYCSCWGCVCCAADVGGCCVCYLP